MKKKKTIISEWYSKIGRKGGLASSEAKAAAVRANGKLGGRPRKKREKPATAL